MAMKRLFIGILLAICLPLFSFAQTAADVAKSINKVRYNVYLC